MMQTSVWALVPVVLLIGLGYVLKRWTIRSESFWSEAERVSYYVLLPALFLHGLATADIGNLPILPLIGALICSTLAVASMVLVLKPLLRLEGDAFTSVFQGSIRYNNYIGVTVAAGLFGAEGIAFAALCNAVIVPVVNLLSVVIFARFGRARLTFTGVLKQIGTNPLILSCVGGTALQALGVGLPPGIQPTLQALGSASMPLGLMCVGAALSFGTSLFWAGPVAASSVVKFAVLPASAFLTAHLFGLTAHALIIAVLFQALPTASSSYLLARRLGGDAPLMATITAFQTLLAIVALPIVLSISAAAI